MLQRKRVFVVVLLTLLVAAFAWRMVPRHEANPTASSESSSSSWWLWPSQVPQGAPTPGASPQPQTLPPEVTAASPLDSVRPPTFRATDAGDLVIDQQTRNDVERVYALYANDGAQKKLSAFSEQLPPPARRQLQDLYQRWSQYAQAVTQTFPPGQSSDTLEEAKRQLAGLKQLRQQYFGADQAQSMFGQEEEIAADLLHRIEDNKDSTMPFDEKVNKAQNDLSKTQQNPPGPASVSGPGMGSGKHQP